MQRLQLKILEPVVFPVGGDGDLGCERKRERHLGTFISGSGTKTECLGERPCFQGIVTKSFSFYPLLLSLIVYYSSTKTLNWALNPGRQGGVERSGLKSWFSIVSTTLPSIPPDYQEWVWRSSFDPGFLAMTSNSLFWCVLVNVNAMWHWIGLIPGKIQERQVGKMPRGD